MTAIPKRLLEEPLVEAMWHVTYDAAAEGHATSELVLAILYAALQSRAERQENSGGAAPCRIIRLPAAAFPPELTARDPNLRRAVKYRLELVDEPVAYQIGDGIVSVNCRRPYVGWSRFREQILFLKEALQASAAIVPNRHGFRYVDLIRREVMPDLTGLQLSVRVGHRQIDRESIELRTELELFEKTHIVQVVAPARVDFPDAESWEGTLVDLETRAETAGWDAVTEDGIDALHDACKKVFFLELLTPETLQKLRPDYE